MAKTGKICFDKSSFYIIIAVGLACIVYTLVHAGMLNPDESVDKVPVIKVQPPQPPVSREASHLANIRRQEDAIRREERAHRPLSGASQNHEDILQIINPLIPPIRKGPLSLARHGAPIFTPTRGEYGKFQPMGYLYNPADADQALPLIGRRIHSNQYEYYTIHHNNSQIKIPIKIQNNKEIVDGDTVPLSGYAATMTVKLYDDDVPRYIPY